MECICRSSVAASIEDAYLFTTIDECLTPNCVFDRTTILDIVANACKLARDVSADPGVGECAGFPPYAAVNNGCAHCDRSRGVARERSGDESPVQERRLPGRGAPEKALFESWNARDLSEER